MTPTRPLASEPDVADTDVPVTDCEAATGVLLDEHRQLANALMLLHALVQDPTTARDYRLLATLLAYVDALAEQFHHPREDRLLIPIIRSRCPEQAAMFERLGEEHRISERMFLALGRLFVAYQAEREHSAEDFVASCAAYCRFHVRHMQAEEQELLPLAAAVLHPTDWAELRCSLQSPDSPVQGQHDRPWLERSWERVLALLPPHQREVARSARAGA